mmetsp:Transcript_24709/g.34617  ORF Transcript_24709/g.34617 Transcript_24709/m.34617 type:complete len:205 (+) Transcript_24709:2093-2707(+)
MSDNSVVFLISTRQKARNINKRYNWDIESVTEPNETSCFHTSVDIQASCKFHWLISHNAHGMSFESAKTDENILCVVWHNLKKAVVVHKFENKVVHIVRLVWIWRNNSVQRFFGTISAVIGESSWWFLSVREWQVIKQLANFLQSIHIILKCPVSNTRSNCVSFSASKVFVSDLFSGDLLHDVRTCYEHVGSVLHHENKVRNCW